MLDKQKQIEEIENIVVEVAFLQAHEPNGDDELSRKVAEAIVNAGIGDTKQAVREFAEKFFKEISAFLAKKHITSANEVKQIIRRIVKETCGE